MKLGSNVPDILCKRRPGQLSQYSNWTKCWVTVASGLDWLSIKLISKFLHWTYSGLGDEVIFHLNLNLVYLHGGMHNRLNPWASYKELKLTILSKHCTSISRVPTDYLIKEH